LKKEYGYDSEESDVCPWASWLPMIMYHMNIQYSETTGETPYKMVTGQEPKSPLIPGAPVHVVDEEELQSTDCQPTLHASQIAATGSDAASTPTAPPDPTSTAPLASDQAAIPQPLTPAADTGSDQESSAHAAPASEPASSTALAPDPGSATNTETPEKRARSSSPNLVMKRSRHEDIRAKARDRTYKSASRMADSYNRKKRVTIRDFSVNDYVPVAIPKIDRASTDLPRLPCVVTEVHGDKVRSYSLAGKHGILKDKYRAGDLMKYSGTIEADLSSRISLRTAAKTENASSKFTTKSCKCTSGCKTSVRCSCHRNGITCTTHCHPQNVCTNQDISDMHQPSSTISLTDREIKTVSRSNGWLTYSHMTAANHAMQRDHPGVDGLQDTILQTEYIMGGTYNRVCTDPACE